MFENKCILSADRVTQMDYWVSYIVYFFDINFKESFDIIAENDYLNRIIDRISYSNPVTKEQMEISAFICRILLIPIQTANPFNPLSSQNYQTVKNIFKLLQF